MKRIVTFMFGAVLFGFGGCLTVDRIIPVREDMGIYFDFATDRDVCYDGPCHITK